MYLKVTGLTWIWMLLLVVAVAAGCGRKPKPAMAPPPEPVRQTEPAQPAEPTTPAEPREGVKVVLQDIFFDFDRHTIRLDQREILAQNARMLSEHPDIRLVLEGHCDERGTVEYNLALGERRAQAVRGYMVEYGVDPARISTISYGEERPFAQGHDETAWALNRRVHFVEK